MDIIGQFTSLFSNFGNLTWQMLVMWIVGGLLIYLAIAKKMEPSLLLPMGFGRHPCQPAPVGRHHPGGHRRAPVRTVCGRYVQ